MRLLDTLESLGLAPGSGVCYGPPTMPADAKGMNGHILVVDDDRETCELVTEVLEHEGFRVTALTSAFAALARVADADFDAVLTDLGMAEMDGIALCQRILEARPDLPVLVGTGQGSLETAIAAMRAGAYDFVTKPFDPKLLAISVGRGVAHHRLRNELKRLRQNIASQAVSGFVGDSAAMRKVGELVSRVADSDASVLIQGETGTGKELVARRIHSSGKRRTGPFIAINCAAVPHALIESELFGHARGAFTDARTERTGLFVEANGGTLFLDEVGELPLETQPKLLRALQERSVRPVGSNSEQSFDVRVVAATNRDLEYEVFEKRFREDLYYRINVVTIELPPLRNRGGDVLEIAQYLLGRFAERAGKPPLTLSPGAAEKLVAYAWPGNVRELENCLERGVALARFNQLTAEDLPDKIRNFRAEKFVVAADDPTEVVTLEALEKSYIVRVLSLVGGNKSQAAQMLGVDRRTLYRKLARYENPGMAETDGESE
jgi:two-component system, NtrC family, response regulator HydG